MCYKHLVLVLPTCVVGVFSPLPNASIQCNFLACVMYFRSTPQPKFVQCWKMLLFASKGPNHVHLHAMRDLALCATRRRGAQVVATLALVAYTMMAVLGASGPASIVLGGGLALSSTAVAMQARSMRTPGGKSLQRGQSEHVRMLVCGWPCSVDSVSTYDADVALSAATSDAGEGVWPLAHHNLAHRTGLGAARPCGGGISTWARHLCRASVPGGAFWPKAVACTTSTWQHHLYNRLHSNGCACSHCSGYRMP